MGSADLMQRNLDHRIEVVAPIVDSRVQAELVGVLDTLFADNASAWELWPDGRWSRLVPATGERPRPSQPALMRRAVARSRRRGPVRRRGDV
jgi:polyphosphate kinase